jgi:hypothetical protein
MIYWQVFLPQNCFISIIAINAPFLFALFWDDFACFAGDYERQRKDGENRFLNIEENNYQKRKGISFSGGSMAF